MSEDVMQVYLIRHAQSEINVMLDEAPLSKRLSTTAFNSLIRDEAASPLTPTGLEQAQQLAERLAPIHFDRLYTSPQPRATATAAALSASTSLTPQIIDDLHELHPALVREHAGDFPLWRLFWRSYTSTFFSPTSPDAFRLAYLRARAVWKQITREPAEAVTVVSHGLMIRMLLLSLRADPRWRIVSRDLTNCGVSLVVRRGNAWSTRLEHSRGK